MLAHLSASPAADALSRAASLQGVCVRRESLFLKLTECQGRASTPTLSAKTRPRAQGEGFSSQCRTCEEQGWGEPVLLPRCCLCSAWEPLPASAEFPAARSASNLGKEKPSLAQHHIGNPAHPSPVPKLVFTASLRPGQRVLPSPAQRGMCIHRDARALTELRAQEPRFCTSQTLP